VYKCLFHLKFAYGTFNPIANYEGFCFLALVFIHLSTKTQVC